MNCCQVQASSVARLAIAIAVSFFLTGASRAATELPDPTIIDSSPAFPGYGVSFFLDDSFAFDYASLGGAANTFVDFDFGGATLITEVVYTDRTTSGGGNGIGTLGGGGSSDNVQGYDLIFDDAPDFATPLFSQSVLSPGFSNTDPVVPVNGGSGITARYVRFDVTATNGVNVGGAEIQFFTVPEPTTLGMVAFWGLVFSLSRSRR
jgi:hypothetical protein